MFNSLKQLIGLFAISLGAMIGPLDTSVNVAFPHIVDDLDQPMEMIRWVVICYVLTYASLMLVFGKLGDLYGRRRIFSIGLAVNVGSLYLISISSSFDSLLFCRFLQGVGTGLTTSVAPALMIALYPESKRSYAVGLFTVVFAVGGLLGPILGGFLVEAFDWRAVFWFRIPISAVSLILIFALPKPNHEKRGGTFDGLGAVTLICSISLCLLTINQFHSLDTNGIWPIIGLGAAASVLIFWFIRHEKAAKEPIVNLDVFQNIEFVILNIASCFLYLTTFSVILIIPFFLYRTEGLSANDAGLILSVGFVGTSIAGLLGGRIIGTINPRLVSFFGVLITGLGLTSISGVQGPDDIPWMIASLVLQGAGTGLFQASYMYSITGMLPITQRGVSGSITMLTRTIGVVSGVTVLTLAFVWLNQNGGTAALDEDTQFQKSFQAIFVLAGGGLLVFLLATMAWPRVWFGRSPN
ncbi:MAG: hypothetical protein CMM58_03495 [Rhodospirillaceae bacterium]|nr:hypothetical protein [Rhodospirillaceae bacterium]